MTTRPLRIALSANLTFSALCGLALIFAGQDIGRLIGGAPAWTMHSLGVGLLVFAGSIALVLRHLRVGFALLISGLDFLWVLTTLPLVAAPGLLTAEGKAIVVLVAAVVGLFGLLQLRGIKSVFKTDETDADAYRLCVRLLSAAQPDALWAVVRDIGAISRYGSGLRSSRIEGDVEPAPGAVRVCVNHKRQRWAEELVSLDDAQRSLKLRFRAEADDFPFPFDKMTGGWAVEPGAKSGSIVEIWWSVRPTQRRLGWLPLALMTVFLEREIRLIVANMEAAALGKAHAPVAESWPALGYC